MENPAIQATRAGRAIGFAAHVTNEPSSPIPALSLHFAQGMRPSVDAILRLAARQADTTSFSVSFAPDPDEGWLELLAMGLTFDLSVLAPFKSETIDPGEHLFGLKQGEFAERGEALRLTPGPHLAGSATMIPVLRILAGLGAELARLPGLEAVGWLSAKTRMAPSYFMSSVRAWLAGGVFPALGLTALNPSEQGGIKSEGLALFAGCEVVVVPLAGEGPNDCAKLAVRAIHHIVQFGTSDIGQVTDGNGRPLRAESLSEGRVMRLWRSL